jgi:hypothetical protein
MVCVLYFLLSERPEMEGEAAGVGVLFIGAFPLPCTFLREVNTARAKPVLQSSGVTAL